MIGRGVRIGGVVRCRRIDLRHWGGHQFPGARDVGLAAILGKLDFDFVFIDGEHRPFADLPRLLSGLSVGQKAVGYPPQARGGIAPFPDSDGSRGCATGVFGFAALTLLTWCSG